MVPSHPYLISPDCPAEERVRHLARAAEAVRKKMVRVYGFSAEEVTSPPAVISALDSKIAYQFEHVRWNEICDAATKTGPQYAQLHTHGLKVLRRYCDAFYLRRQVIDRSLLNGPGVTNPTYKSYKVGRGLMDIYINHLTNLTEAELQQQGLDRWTAHAINGFLIGQSVVLTRERDKDMAYVNPQQPERPVFQAELDEQLRAVGVYWRTITRYITPEILAGHAKPTQR